MVTKVSSSIPAASQCGHQLPPVEATALVVRHRAQRDQLSRLAQVLEAGGMAEFKPALIMLSQRDTKTVASGRFTSVDVTLVAASHLDPAPIADPETDLEQALTEPCGRGAVLKDRLLASPAMLSTAPWPGGLACPRKAFA